MCPVGLPHKGDNWAGFLLVGGRSSRMGTDKALLPWGGTTVVEHLAELLERTVGSATLVGEPIRYQHLSLPVLADLQPGQGPLSGIEAALASGQARWNLILACDIPAVSSDLLVRLKAVAGAQDSCSPVLVRDSTGRVHPLCAAYHQSLLPRVRAFLAAGERRLMKLVDSLQPVYVEADQELRNINTLEEWHAATSSR